jgi:hypothetical protein
MNRFWASVVLLSAASLSLACGSSNNRQLQSITITQTANGQQIEFVATGNFSSAPATVTSIPVMWSVQLMAPPPPQYTLTTQPFRFECTASGPIPIVAYAPSDPNAPLSGSWASAKMIQASTVITCPSGGSSPPSVVNVAGNWTGTVSDTDFSPPLQGSATLNLTEGGSGSLTATIEVSGVLSAIACNVENQLNGSVMGTQVSLSSGSDIFPMTVQATVDTSGQHLNGTYHFALSGIACVEDGTISLTKQ